MTGGYSVYVGMEIDSGDLLALYEWSFQSKKKLDSRRTKQVAILWCIFCIVLIIISLI